MRLAIVLLVLACAVPARADDLEKAKALYDEGLRHYNVAEYDAAIAAWKQAYVLSKRPLLLFNIGQAYRLAGDCPQALAFYENYRREEERPKRELAAAVEECQNKPKPLVPPPAPAVPPPPLDFGPIPHIVGTPPDRTKRIAGIVVGSFGVVAGGAATWFAIDSKRQSDKLDGYEGAWDGDQAAIEARGRRDVKLAFVAGAASAVTVVTAGVLFWLGRDRREIAVDVAPIPRGGTASWTVHW
jgi:tetratricopeptide (TPR) repeat protein